MITRYQCQRDLILFRTLLNLSVAQRSQDGIQRRLTRGSEMMPGVWTCTTRWTNLIQHTRTPIGAVSHLLRMLDLIAAMSAHFPDS